MAAVACDDVSCATHYSTFYNLVVVRISDHYIIEHSYLEHCQSSCTTATLLTSIVSHYLSYQR